MLVISRRKGQRIVIGDDIELIVTELHRSSVKVGIRAPRGYAVLRGEVRDSIETANRDAAETTLDSVSLDESLGGSANPSSPVDLLLGLRPPAVAAERQTRDSPTVTEVIVRRPRSGTEPRDDVKPSEGG